MSCSLPTIIPITRPESQTCGYRLAAAPFGQRKTPFHVIGATGAKALMENLQKAYALDIRIRIKDERLLPEGIAVRVEEFDKEGVVYEKSGVKVTAFEVDHGDAIKPAFGYRSTTKVIQSLSPVTPASTRTSLSTVPAPIC